MMCLIHSILEKKKGSGRDDVVCTVPYYIDSHPGQLPWYLQPQDENVQEQGNRPWQSEHMTQLQDRCSGLKEGCVSACVCATLPKRKLRFRHL